MKKNGILKKKFVDSNTIIHEKKVFEKKKISGHIRLGNYHQNVNSTKNRKNEQKNAKNHFYTQYGTFSKNFFVDWISYTSKKHIFKKKIFPRPWPAWDLSAEFCFPKKGVFIFKRVYFARKRV